MSLKELEKDLQSQKSKIANREHNKTVYNEWQSKEGDVKESTWQRIKDKMQDTRIKAIVVGGIIVSAIVLLLLAGATFVFFQSGFFAQDRVSLAIEAPQNANSNELAEIIFVYENDNRANLDNAEITIRFDDYFVPVADQDRFTRVSDSQGIVEVGTIKSGQKKSVSLAGHFVGPQDSIASIAGSLRYIPERQSARYDADARSTTVITSSPVTVDIESPNEIVSGNLIDVIVKVQNMSNSALSDIKLTVDVPEGFSLYDTEPRASHGNVWLINQILPQSELEFHVRGGIDASVGSVQKFQVEVGTQESGGSYVTYANQLYTPRIIQSPILVKQSIRGEEEGVAYAGDRLNYSVSFINNSDIPLRDAVVILNMDSEVFDFSTLELQGQGDYDQENRRIVWRAADVPDLRVLKPNETGEVSFAISVKNKLPVNNENDHHFSAVSIASIDSNDIPAQLRENKTVLSNILTVPVGAKVILSPKSQHVSGPQPPKVGEKTTYNIVMKVDSINNDITNAIVHIPLPTHSIFDGKENDGLTFNERTNDIMWDIGSVAHGTGVTSESKEISFDVSIVPSVEQVQSLPELIKEQTLTAMDKFADTQVKEIVAPVTTGSDGRFNLNGAVQP